MSEPGRQQGGQLSDCRDRPKAEFRRRAPNDRDWPGADRLLPGECELVADIPNNWQRDLTFASLCDVPPLTDERLLSPCNTRAMSQNEADLSVISMDPGSFGGVPIEVVSCTNQLSETFHSRGRGAELEITGESIDDVLIAAYARIQAEGTPNIGSRGPNKELIGVTLRIQHPRARLSRSADRGRPFSALGEFLWYLTGTGDVGFITAYISRYANEVGPSGEINGAYGPRIFARYGLDQLDAVRKLLQRKPSSRRAVVQIYSATDLLTDEEVPCTTTLQFFLRDGFLHLAANLRSNDAYLGLPHDVFCFTMLQEMMARRLGVDLGEYVQMVGSFHLYDKDMNRVTSYTAEGYHRFAPMPPMPSGDPFPIVPRLLDLEKRIRQGELGELIDDEIATLEPYWANLLRLVQLRFAPDDDSRLDEISDKLCEPAYRTYLEDWRAQRTGMIRKVTNPTDIQRGPAE